jgi:hypothetical protein
MYGAEVTNDTPLAEIRPFPEQGTYRRQGKTYTCELYPGGNKMPEAHRTAGELLAASVKPDSDGTIVAITVGHSNSHGYFQAYDRHLNKGIKEGTINPALRLQSLCKSGKMCQAWAAGGAPAETNPKAQIMLLVTSYHNARIAGTMRTNPEVFEYTFEERTEAMKKDLTKILQSFAKACPELKLAYVGCDTWRGNSDLEPAVWEEAFAFQRLIAAQIAGDPELAFTGPDRKVPWIAWGGYFWENNPPKERFANDGIHPSAIGLTFAVERWHAALLGNSTSRYWLTAKK